MLLSQWFVAQDLPLDVSRVARRWLDLMLADASLGSLQPWQDVYHPLMVRLAEVLEDPAGTSAGAGAALGTTWQALRRRDPDGFDRVLFYLQVAWQEYLDQAQQTRSRAESFFADLLETLHGDPLPVEPVRDLIDWLPGLLPGEQGREAVAAAVVAAAQRRHAWPQAALFWWDAATAAYRPLHVRGGFAGAPPAAGREEATVARAEALVDIQWPWLRLWQPLLQGQGLLAVSRPARAPVRLTELQTLATLAAQTEVLMVQAETVRRAQDSRHALSRQVVELATVSAERDLLKEIVQLSQRFDDGDALADALLERLGTALVAARSEWWRFEPLDQTLRRRRVHGDVAGTGQRPLPESGWLAQASDMSLMPVLRDESGRRIRTTRPPRGRRLIMPVCAGERFIGTIDFVRDADVAPFTEADLALAATLAGFVAPLIRQLELHDELALQARLDPLTGLPHRQHLRHLLETAWDRSRREGQPFSLLLVDVDRLRQINETLGFPVGDAMLRTVSDRLVAGVSRLGTVGRWGDDTFLVMLPGLGRPEAQRLARRLYRACSVPGDPAGMPWPLAVSLGRVTADPEDCTEPEHLLRAAEEELQQAKSKRDQLRLAQYWEQDDDGVDPSPTRADRR